MKKWFHLVKFLEKSNTSDSNRQLPYSFRCEIAWIFPVRTYNSVVCNYFIVVCWCRNIQEVYIRWNSNLQPQNISQRNFYYPWQRKPVTLQKSQTANQWAGGLVVEICGTRRVNSSLFVFFLRSAFERWLHRVQISDKNSLEAMQDSANKYCVRKIGHVVWLELL